MARTLYIAEGSMTVDATGYWFSAGGVKGAFGYYPHLKDSDGHPVYPDTQIMGNLRMAANWLHELDKDKYPTYFIDRVFGIKREAGEALFNLTDLELSGYSRFKWKPERFDIKHRIKIDDASRTVENNMLVSFEMAYLEGLQLEVRFYLGYFDTRDELDMAYGLITDAAQLLSGFGAFRSRGYGRGRIKFCRCEPEEITYYDNRPTSTVERFPYELRALVNLRNKPIISGRTQLIESIPYISGQQLRGWLAKTFHRIFDRWPTLDEMAAIRFPDLYPSDPDSNDCVFGYLPPPSTLKFAEDDIRDVTGRPEDDNDNDDETRDQQNFYNTKPKPLPSDMFVTNTDPPKIIGIKTEKRFRNHIDEDFTTIKDGLFIQGLIARGTSFGGTITFDTSDDNKTEFLKKALFILKHVRATIKGAIFDLKAPTRQPLHVSPPDTAEDTSSNTTPYLVSEPIPYSAGLLDYSTRPFALVKGQKDRVVKPHANQILLTTISRYNTTLKRPRRNRIVIAQGSIVYGRHDDESAIRWKGFGKDVIPQKKEMPPDDVRPTKADVNSDIKDVAQITRAQAGILIEFLNPAVPKGFVQDVLKDRIEKYKKWGEDISKKDLIPEKILAMLLKTLEDWGIDEMRRCIKTYLDVQYQLWWKEKQQRQSKEAGKP
ncbi:MAG: hypothetical protein HQL03_09310 [Nitrospirae bacterium]|nr:hypothetical protein [Nitrospirota bacterium]MBF0592519.1 hypothetical protein [Nitrospirota bacterium]